MTKEKLEKIINELDPKVFMEMYNNNFYDYYLSEPNYKLLHFMSVFSYDDNQKVYDFFDEIDFFITTTEKYRAFLFTLSDDELTEYFKEDGYNLEDVKVYLGYKEGELTNDDYELIESSITEGSYSAWGYSSFLCDIIRLS